MLFYFDAWRCKSYPSINRLLSLPNCDPTYADITSAKSIKTSQSLQSFGYKSKSVIITGNYEEYRLAPCLMLFNFIDLLRGVTILDSNHMISSGNIIIRSMFEILLDFLYCETNRKLYLRFGKYQDVSRVLLYKSVPQDIKNQVDKEKYNSITFPNFDNSKVKYNIKDDKKELSNWCGKSIFQRVKIVSKRIAKILNLYYNIYKLNYDYTHNYAGTITQYVN